MCARQTAMTASNSVYVGPFGCFCRGERTNRLFPTLPAFAFCVPFVLRDVGGRGGTRSLIFSAGSPPAENGKNGLKGGACGAGEQHRGSIQPRFPMPAARASTRETGTAVVGTSRIEQSRSKSYLSWHHRFWALHRPGCPATLTGCPATQNRALSHNFAKSRLR